MFCMRMTNKGQDDVMHEPKASTLHHRGLYCVIRVQQTLKQASQQSVV